MLRRFLFLIPSLLLLMMVLFPPVSYAALDSAICGSVAEIPLAECQALIALYNSTNGDSWSSHTNWGSNSPSTWQGVTVSGGRVTAISLAGNNLTGSIPTEIGSLTGLTSLALHNNQLGGIIPSSLGNLTNLTALNLSSNQLGGNVPLQFKNLVSLSSSNTDIGYNKLTASDPLLVAFLNSKDANWAQTQTIPPIGAQATPLSGTSVEVSWLPIAYTGDGGYYEVGYSTTSGGPYILGCSSGSKTDTNCTISGLLSTKFYFFAVRTFTPAHGVQVNDLWSIYSSDTTVTPVLASPTDGATVTTTLPTFTWNAVSGAAGYRIQIDNNSDFSSTVVSATATGATYTSTVALASGTTYYWRIQAKNSANYWGAWSFPWSVMVDTTAPTVPTLSLPPNNGTPETTDKPTFDWNSVSDIDLDHYVLQVDNVSNFSSPEINLSVVSSIYTPTVGLADTLYYWRVQSVDAAGNKSAWSTVWRVQVNAIPTVVPTLTAPTNNFFTKDNTPLFTWSTVAGASQYMLQASKLADFSTLAISVTVTTATYTPTAVLTDGVYYWRVKARAALDGMWSEWSTENWIFTVDTVAPAAPTQSGPTNNGTVLIATPEFTWNAVADAVKYDIQIDNDADFSSPVGTFTVIGATSYTPAAPLGEMVFSWRLRSYDLAGNRGVWSAVWKVRVNADPTSIPTLTAPADLAFVKVKTPQFTWTSARAAQYKIQIATDNLFGTPVADALVTVATYKPTTALVDGVYYWRVQTKDSVDGLWGDWSIVRSFTVDTIAPAIPVLGTPGNGEIIVSNLPTFDWGDVVDTHLDHYEIQVDNDSTFASPISSGSPVPSTYTATGTPYPDNLYYWRVRAYDVAGNFSAWSAVWTVRVDADPTNVPTLAAPANGLRTKVTKPVFSWNLTADANQYRLQVDNDPAFGSPAINVLVTTLNYTPTVVLPNATYSWRVQAKDQDDGVWGAWSPVWTFDIDTVAPGVPVLVGPTGTLNINNPTFEWQAVVDANLDHYEIQIDDNATYASPETVSRTTLTYPYPGTFTDGVYYWRGRAYDDAGNSGAWSASLSFRIDAVPASIPTLMLPVDGLETSQTQYVFVWSNVGATRYELQVDNTAGFASPEIKVLPTAATYTRTTVLANGVYWWRVRALAVDGLWSDWSVVRQFTVDLTKPLKPVLGTPGTGTTEVTGTPVFQWDDVAGAHHYEFQLDNAATFPSPNIYEETSISEFTPSEALTDGLYYWRVQAFDAAGNFSGWTAAWNVRINAVPTPVVTLLLPVDNSATNQTMPSFSWNPAAGIISYRLQVDNTATFASPEINIASAATLYTPAIALVDGVYNWRVQAQGADGLWGDWSAVFKVTIDTVKPGVPTLASPASGSVVTTSTPAFDWNDVVGAHHYEIQISSAAAFAPVDVSAFPNNSTYTPAAMADKVYYWRVRSYDAAGNRSAWSTIWSVTVDAVAGAPQPSALMTIEAENATVQPNGAWTAYNSDAASGGTYLYSSGVTGEALVLSFEGTQADVVYVQHPALGTFAVEVDGVLLQTINSTSADTVFGARVSLGYLNPGVHTLRVYAVDGTVAFDAFAIDNPSAVVVEPTPAPTIEHSIDVPLETVDEPTTADQQPIQVIPFADNLEMNWGASGSWQPDTQSAYSGNGWFVEALTRNQSSTLTANYQINLGTATAPQLSFWQKMTLTNGDVAAVDISVDGGVTWLPLDAQIGVAAGEWMQRVVDLSIYRGATIQLRFRLDTFGAVPANETTFGWWVDELMVADTVPSTPAPTEDTWVVPTAIPTDVPVTDVPPTDVPATPTEESGGWVLPTPIP